jgi:hypothetical protein
LFCHFPYGSLFLYFQNSADRGTPPAFNGQALVPATNRNRFRAVEFLKVEFDFPNLSFIELPEDELTAVP